EHYEDGRLELFHLRDDPGETKNLARTEPHRATAMWQKLAEWRRSVGAQENRPNPDFDPALHKRLYLDVDVSKIKPTSKAAQMTKELADWRRAMDAAVREPPTTSRQSSP